MKSTGAGLERTWYSGLHKYLGTLALGEAYGVIGKARHSINHLWTSLESNKKTS